MNLSAASGLQLSQLQQTVNLSLLNRTMMSETAQAMAMMEDFASSNQPQVNAPHPTLGTKIDLKA